MAARLQRLLVIFGLGLALICSFGSAAIGGIWWGAVVVLAAVASYPAVLALELTLAITIGRRSGRFESMPPAGPRQLCGAWLGEIVAGVRTFCWEQPFHTHSVPDELPASSRGFRGVVLVHGLFCNRAFWNSWMRTLRSDGRVPFAAVTLEPLFGSIDNYTASVDAAVRRMTGITGLAPVVVAHSMGGLVVRRWLSSQRATGRVCRVITIGTPHQGTWLARFARSANAREMAIESQWLDDLRKASRVADASLFTCFHSNCDNVVFPVGNATLPGADNRLLPGLGHVQLASHPAAMAELLRFVGRPMLD